MSFGDMMLETKEYRIGTGKFEYYECSCHGWQSVKTLRKVEDNYFMLCENCYKQMCSKSEIYE
jgi:hypothetical protein